MMLLGFCDLSDPIRKLERLLEVLELERTFEVAGVVQAPRTVELAKQRFGAAPLERRNTASAWHAMLIG